MELPFVVASWHMRLQVKVFSPPLYAYTSHLREPVQQG
jgi:hypothetical protein